MCRADRLDRCEGADWQEIYNSMYGQCLLGINPSSPEQVASMKQQCQFPGKVEKSDKMKKSDRSSLSGYARKVINIALAPPEVIQLRTALHSKKTTNMLTKKDILVYLLARGWDIGLIWRTFRELKQYVAGF